LKKEEKEDRGQEMENLTRKDKEKKSKGRKEKGKL